MIVRCLRKKEKPLTVSTWRTISFDRRPPRETAQNRLGALTRIAPIPRKNLGRPGGFVKPINGFSRCKCPCLIPSITGPARGTVSKTWMLASRRLPPCPQATRSRGRKPTSALCALENTSTRPHPEDASCQSPDWRGSAGWRDRRSSKAS